MSAERRAGGFIGRWTDIVGDGGPPRRRWALGLYAGHLLALGTIALSNLLLGLAALLTPWRWSRQRLRAARPLLWAIGAYLLFLGASIATSHAPGTSLRAGSDLFNFLVPVAAVALVRSAAQARLLVRALILVGSVIALGALWEYFAAVDPLGQRPTGPFSHYMTLGGFLVLVDCFLLAWMAFAGGWRRWWCWLAFAVIQAALLISYTRNAWVALALLVTLVALLRAPKLLLAWIPAIVVLTLLAPSALLARFGSIFDLADQSNYDRLCMGYAGVHMVLDRPLLGQGPRMVRERYALYRHPTTPRPWVPHLHNSFLNLAAERGLLSLAAFLALLAVASRRALLALRERPAEGVAPDLLYATLLVVLATVVTGLFEDYWSDTEIQRLVLFALALPFCLPDEASAGPADAASGSTAT